MGFGRFIMMYMTRNNCAVRKDSAARRLFEQYRTRWRSLSPQMFVHLHHIPPAVQLLPQRILEPEFPKLAKCCWLSCFGGATHSRAVYVGADKDGGPLYVSRGLYDGDLVPGKLPPNYSCTFVPWGGHERNLASYEVLVLGSGTAEWRIARGGDIPAQALPSGFTKDGDILFSARATVDGVLTPGKILPSEGVCRIGYDGKEWLFAEYEVLIVS